MILAFATCGGNFIGARAARSYNIQMIIFIAFRERERERERGRERERIMRFEEIIYYF